MDFDRKMYLRTHKIFECKLNYGAILVVSYRTGSPQQLRNFEKKCTLSLLGNSV